jgi:hypothetical protein
VPGEKLFFLQLARRRPPRWTAELVAGERYVLAAID